MMRLFAFPITILALMLSAPAFAYYDDSSNYDEDSYYESDYDNPPPRTVYKKNNYQVKKAKYKTSGPSYISGSNVFVFDPRRHAWYAYSNGKLVKSGRASGGKSYCPDIGRGCKTIVGSFRVISKGNADCKSTRFPVETNGGAPMPYCMHFHPKGYAVHGSYDVPNYNASHGCVRVQPQDAYWLSHNFMRIGTTVIVRPY